MKTIPEILSSPLALLPSAATAMLEAYRVSTLHVSHSASPPARADFGTATGSEMKPYEVVCGIAIIPICGVLTHEESFWWDEVSYSCIASKVAAAITDTEVLGILMHVNSPGGVVSGCFDLADALYGMRGSKPMWAVVDESAYSAAYALASAADRIILPRTGGVGSVGVITMHIDITKMLEDFGVKVTTIQFGDRKSDSYPTTPLSDAARKLMQRDIDVLGEMFVDLVARNRGMSASDVRDTQAGCFLGEEGVKTGFADAVMPVEEAIMEFISTVNKGA